MIERKTVFSECRKYRYVLWREWQSHLLTEGLFDSGNRAKDGYVMFIGLNPSTADETLDDPTIRRCKAFAKSWGYGAMCMTNLFAWRDTSPAKMKKQPNPVGQDNHHHLLQVASGAALVIAAWGNHGKHMNQDLTVKQWLRSICMVMCLRKTADGSPEHPLYLPKTLTPIPL